MPKRHDDREGTSTLEKTPGALKPVTKSEEKVERPPL
jgi:hypothetical protein